MIKSINRVAFVLLAIALLAAFFVVADIITLKSTRDKSEELTYISLTEEGLGQLTIGLPSESFKSIKQIDDMSSEYIDSILSSSHKCSHDFVKSDIDFFGEDIGYYIEQGSERVFISKDIVVFIRFGSGNNKSDEVQAALTERDYISTPANVRVKTLGDGAVTVMVASVSSATTKEGGTCKSALPTKEIDAIMNSLKFKKD